MRMTNYKCIRSKCQTVARIQAAERLVSIIALHTHAHTHKHVYVNDDKDYDCYT